MLPRLHLLLPVVVIVALLALGRSPMRAAFWGVAAAALVPLLVPATRVPPRRLADSLLAAAASTVQVAAACAAAGIVVGVASLTGIGLRMSELIVTLSFGQLPIALGLTALGSLILGLGLPTTAAYVVLAALGAPALVEMGVPVLAAHLFVFYFGCMSNVTPPVALAGFAAAGIAGASPMRTAVAAMGLASAGFLIPFMFVYGPALLLDGPVHAILLAAATGFAGVVALAAAVVGHARRPLHGWERLLLAVAAVALLYPGWMGDAVGLSILGWSMMRGRSRRFAVAALCGLMVGACGAGEAGRAEYLSIGTAGTGGIFYPLGGALASRLSVLDPDRRFTAEVSGGSVENVKRLANRQIDLGFAIGTTVHEAYHGGPDFPAPVADLRIVAPLYPNVTHVLVPGGSPVRSVADLRGRRVSVGSAGSGTEQLARHLLAASGLDYADVQPSYLTFAESASALRDRAIAAAIFSVGYPASAVLEVTTTGDARLLPVESPVVERLRAAHPYYFPGTIPAGSYRGVDRDVPTFAVMNWIVARADLPDDVARAVLRILRDERDRLERVSEIVRQVDLATLHDAPIPLHPATAAWLAENE